ncbi:MAG: cytochrome c3 family protein [Acidobacteriota bacterium]|nr:MAG: cytochrome c3 family protein [Acidobacteriota bacterium]
MCHSDPDLSVQRRGQVVRLFVDEEKFSASVHGGLDCIFCHADLDGAEFPHEVSLERADCSPCHEELQEKYDVSLHGRAAARGDPLAPLCQDCHGSHEILPTSDPESAVVTMKVPFLCGRCHREGSPVTITHDIPQEKILEHYSQSIHGEGLFHRGLSVTAVCTSCHTAHDILPHTDPRSSIARQNIAKTCARCHELIEDVHRKIVEGELWEKEPHRVPACVDCHEPHKARKVFYDQGMADRDCLSCHDDETLTATRDGETVKLYADKRELAGSMHSKVTCAQCHTGCSPDRVRACETVIPKVDCSVCHAEVVQEYTESVHGSLAAKDDPNAPLCADCHSEHGALGKYDPESPIFPTNIPALCALCHREGEKAAVRYAGEQHEIIKHYTESIHGKGLLQSGLVVTATCTSCHTAHHELPHTDPRSSIARQNIAKTCARCHNGIYEQFVASIHSPKVSRTEKELPVCDTCHTAHTIRRIDIAGFKLEIMKTCGNCHLEIAETYFETYHGKVSQLGYVKTAKCYDCHGSHDILPIENPRSLLSRQNVVATCQKCHPGATRRFAGYLTHATHHDPDKYPWLFFTFWGMTGLLVGVFTVGWFHTLLWFPRAIEMRRKRKHAKIQEERQFRRFTRLNSILHVLMVASFLSLALTGMTLKFSYTNWALLLSNVLGGFESAGYIHRLAAVVMFGVFFVHLADLVKNKRKYYGSWRALLFGPDTMIPTLRDVREAWGSLKWFVGRGERPSYGRWTYWEKFDYFAVFWGIAIIGSTGLILWMPELFTLLLPGWLINVATIIHSDEALLATGFIFTVHFFNTHLRPEKFPMDITVFTGRMPLEEFEDERPDEHRALVESGELEKYLVEPLPSVVVRTIRGFAWAALAVGFIMVVWIVYAMVAVYR